MENVLRSTPEWWTGIECTINRVGDRFQDQLHLSNHYNRETDIRLIASLGIKTIRYPVLWERHQPDQQNSIDWSQTEIRLNQLRDAGIDPIVGFVHHGSGPAFTDLLDEQFAEKLSCYADQFAQKFPWVTSYTPLNEPLTTARFSGLYGFWYPHEKNASSFARIFLNECKAIVFSMKKILKHNANAKLIQTEDLGKTYSTEHLKYQADFENERRWLTYDVLCGRLNRDHPLWEYFISRGIPEHELLFFISNVCKPDVMGLNHYVTSERFLDENQYQYPPHTYGGNDVEQYADVEAIRVDHDEPSGLNYLLTEAWDRYGLPIAITEAHLNCTREHQLRWLHHVWNTATDLRGQGVNVVAVTAWSLFGSFGWNKLLTSFENPDYEPGVFDIRSPEPRATGLYHFIQRSIQRQQQHDVALQTPWWQRGSRFYSNHAVISNLIPERKNPKKIKPLLIAGRNGTLGKAFARICHQRGIAFQILSREQMDITCAEAVYEQIRLVDPWAIINTCGYVRVNDAETEVEKCFRENTTGADVLAQCCKMHHLPFVTFSSDLVFDGKKNSPYVESDIPSPLNNYGRSKAGAENTIISLYPESLVIRTSSFFGPWDRHNFAYKLLCCIKNDLPFEAFENLIVSPTYVPDLVNTTLDLLIDEVHGIWHLSNEGVMSWFQFAKLIASITGNNAGLIRPVKYADHFYQAKLPFNSALASEKAQLMPTLEDAVKRFYQELEISILQSEEVVAERA